MKVLLLKAVTLLLVSLLATPVFAQGRVTRPQVPLPEGPLRNVILHNCVACHGIDDYAFYALSRENWQELLQEKHSQYPVKLSGSDENLLLDYLAENFGTEHTPFPRQWVPPEITTFYGDPEGRHMLDTVCSECHALDRVFETRGTLERWRVLMLEMRARGAEFGGDDDVERMAEWLSRVQSANTFE